MTFTCTDCGGGLSQLGTNKMFCGACGCTFEVTITVKKVSGPVRDAGHDRKRELPSGDDGGG